VEGSVLHVPRGNGRPPALRDLGTTKRLTLLPLLDWHAARPDLETDAGVSYLVETDDITVLFDTGNNTRNSDPAPLETNMETLGVSIDDINAVVISHAHFDHTGGRRWTDGGIAGTTCGIGTKQPSLAGKTIVTPAPMTYPGSNPVRARDPLRLAPGVGTTGTIARKLFGGWIDEQALAVNVEGKGIVLIVGCGHQTIPRLVERTEAVFDAPLYGVIGRLHYPVPEGRMRMFGIDVQRRLASGIGPLAPLTAEDVRADIELLKERHLGVVSVGGHDSSDEAIGWFRDTFGPAYRDLRVGAPIQIPPGT
jgi:7,8-dihydropterin-6-yl-methyl-4-(beta-D-ribofuranosyl)aminobenzene 5'-phosphate synthase